MRQYRVRERLHDNLLEHLLLSRGVLPEERDSLLAPDYSAGSHDPFLLPDMAAAVERVVAAHKNSEIVAVWSDYDCDGIPGGVLLAEYLRAMGLVVVYYIPHRHKEGYGLNQAGIDELAAQKVSLMITVDLGTTEVEMVEYAKQKGIDTIVTDHHEMRRGEQVETNIAQRDGASIANFQQEIMRVRQDFVLPKAIAVINPKRPDSQYPFDGLCGAGVAWKLVQALQAKGGYMKDGQEKWLLDMAGLGTLSDMVPLVGENRMLAHFGLRVMRRARRPGLKALLDLLRIKPATLTEDDVAFMVTPRINAASRMDNPALAAALLGATEPERGAELARELNRINDERKTLVATTVKEANKRLSLGTPSPVIVMGSPEWRPGILGLVANSLMEAHGKPVFLWGKEGGSAIRGSVRSNTVSVVAMMSAAKDVFAEYGGHTGSGGFSVADERVHELPTRLAHVYEALAAQASEPTHTLIDRELSLAEVRAAHREVQQLAPFGTGWAKPLFVMPQVSVMGMRVFGKQKNHLELTLERDGARSTGIAFFSTGDSFGTHVAPGTRADIVGHLELDWRGAPRIRVVDVL